MSNVHHYTQVPKVGWVTSRPSGRNIKNRPKEKQGVTSHNLWVKKGADLKTTLLPAVKSYDYNVNFTSTLLFCTLLFFSFLKR